MKNKYIYNLILALGFLATFSSCKKEYETIESIDQRKIQEYITKNNLTVTKDPSGFYYQVLDPGTGDVLANKDSVLFTFSYKSLENGSSYYTFPDYSNAGTYLGYLASPSYPSAFRTALTGLKYGAKVRIIIPSYLAFGKNGSTSFNVPSNEIIDCQLSTFTEKHQVDLDDRIIREFLAAKNLTATKDVSRVYYITNQTGSGTDAITSASTLKLNYTGRLLNGTVFDSSTDGKFSSTLANLIKGWGKIVPKYTKGAKFRVIIPSDLAYGTAGYGQIPANSVLDFDIEIVDVTN